MTSIPSTSPIIVTPNLLASTMDAGLLNDQASLASLEQQIATGNAINVASDNPPAAATMLQLQAGLSRANQYASNAADAQGWLSLANSTVGSILSILQNVQSLVESASGSSLSGQSTTRTATADQIEAALNQITNLANTTYAGNQAIFAGTGSQAYDANGNYQGAGNAPTRTVAPGTQVPISLTGQQIFGSGAAGSPGNGLLGNGQGGAPVGVLQQIVNDLNANNMSALQGQDLTNLQSAISTVETAAGKLGAYQQQVEGFAQQATSSVNALTEQLGNVQSTNVAQAITSLQLQQTAYQEALYATSQLSTQSLAAYL
jgi:flagellar hook-associated protein 3 FlgL